MKSTLKPLQFPTQPTSTAVQQLYAKFQNLKQRISNSDSKRSTRSIDRRQFVEKNKDSKLSQIGSFSPMPLAALMSQVSDCVKEDDSSAKHTTQLTDHQSIMKSFTDQILTSFKQVQQQYLKRTHNLMAKLSVTQQKLTKISSTIKQKKLEEPHNQKTNQSFTDNINNTTRCHTFKSLSENTIQNHFLTTSKLSADQIEQRHRLEIRSIIQNYENKISAILEGSSDKSVKSLSTCQYLGLDMMTQSQKLEELIANKQKDIRELTGQNKKLKRMLQQAKMNFQRNGELNKLLKEENRMLEVTVEKLQGWKKQHEAQKKNDQTEIDKLKTELRIRSLEVKKLKEQLEVGNVQKNANIGVKGQVSNKLQQKCNFQRKKQAEQKQSQIERVITDRSYNLENEQRLQKPNDNKPQQHQQLELDQQCLRSITRSRSLVMNRTQLAQITNLRRQTELLSQVQLLEQENRLLKWKKDQFQSEVKKAQNDEDMMQQQLTRLNQEIRRLNAFWHLLDECGLKLLKGESLVENSVALLESQSKLREEFYKLKEKKKRGFSLRR